MRIATLTTLVVLLVLTAACGDKTPAKITTAAPAMILSTNLVSLSASVVNKKGEALSGQHLSYASTPADVVEVSAGGAVRCLKTGDASLTLSAGGLSEQLPLKCRLPTEIVMPRDMQLVLARPPAPLRPQALGEGGRPLDDVVVEVTSSDPSVVAVEGGRLKPVAVGKAKLQASAGGITAVTPVEVVESVVSESLTLRDGASRSFTLQTAYYLVTIELKTDPRLKQGVTVGWSGTACDDQPERASHHFNCRVAETATMTVTNPKLMGVGATVTGTVNVFRVPG